MIFFLIFAAVMLSENKEKEKNEETTIQSPGLGSLAPSKRAILDNIVGHQSAEHSFNHKMPADNAKDDQAISHGEAFSHSSHRVCSGLDKHNKSLNCHRDISESKSVLCCNELHMDSSGLQDEVDIPTCNSFHKGDFVEEIREANENVHESTMGVVITFDEKNLKTAPDNMEGNV